METNEKTNEERAKDIREKLSKNKLAENITEYFSDILCDNNFEIIAKMHSCTIKQFAFSNYEDGCEPDYFIFEVRTKDKEHYGEHSLNRVIEIIFALLDCCDESAVIEVYDLDERYVRVKVYGHYHS